MAIENEDTTVPAPRIFDITYGTHELDENGEEIIDVVTKQGYLSVTPDFVALQDENGLVTFCIPSNNLVMVESTGIVETPVGPAN